MQVSHLKAFEGRGNLALAIDKPPLVFKVVTRQLCFPLCFLLTLSGKAVGANDLAHLV